MTDPSGGLNAFGQPRKFKALFAPLIIDLSGRINVNVHGNVRDTNNRTARSSQGWGPWEVNPAWVLNQADPTSQVNPPPAEWPYLFLGKNGVPGRYGADQQPGRKKRGKAREDAGEDRRRGPHEQASREHEAHGKAVRQPAGDADELEEGVRPEERREQRAECAVRKREIPLHDRGREREIAPVDIVEEDRHDEQRQQPALRSGH